MTSISPHISFEKLTDFAEHRIARDEQTELQAHLNSCSQCAIDLARINHFHLLMRGDNMTDAPPAVLARAVSIFRPQTSETKPSFRERLVALLEFDSLNLSQAHGVRSAATAGARQMLFNAGGYTIDVRMAESGEDGWIVSGQVIGDKCADGRVVLQGTNQIVEAQLSDVCEFVLPLVQAGEYTMRFIFADAQVDVLELKLDK